MNRPGVPLRLVFLIGAACASPRAASEHSAVGSATTPGAAWVRVQGGSGTRCALGTPYSFFVHAGNPRHLMVYLQGGGACWNGDTCDVDGRATFDPQVDSTDDPARFRGILSLTNAENPVRDYTIVFVPYCTGDTFLGGRTVTYTSGPGSRNPGRTFQIHHVGALDVRSALEWAYANVRNPDIVFVTGSSAGAIPSPVYAAQAAKHYPKARVVQLGDAGGGYRSPAIPGLLEEAGVLEQLRRDRAYHDIESTAVTHPLLYVVSARESPRISFAQYNSAEDSTQISFLRLLRNDSVPLQRTLAENLAEIRRGVSEFREYTAPGHVHTILLRPQFYALAVDGVRVRDWVAALLDGAKVQDVGGSLLATVHSP